MKLSELNNLLLEGKIDKFLIIELMGNTDKHNAWYNSIDNIEIAHLIASKRKELFNGRCAALSYTIKEGWTASTIEKIPYGTERWVTRKIDIDSDWIINYESNKILNRRIVQTT